MTDKKKTEVNLEMCSGFFRIPTDDIIYNITVLSSNEPSTSKVMEKIIEGERFAENERSLPAAASTGDDYFRQCACTLQQKLTEVAREADHPPTDSPGLDLDTIQDLTAMATDLKEVLIAIKNQLLSSKSGTTGVSAMSPVALSQLAAKIVQAKALSTDSAPPLPAAQDSTRATKTVTRYLFDLDTVFQTIYELCTNETVKGHIQNARAKAEEIFDKGIFSDAISPLVSGYPEDDGFLTVPMTDIYTALGSACSDKAIRNLLAKMDKQQASIFLDQFLPLEVPPQEEVTIPQDGDTIDDMLITESSSDSTLTTLLGECRNDIEALIDQGGTDGRQVESEELITKVEDAITIAASIQADAGQLAAGAAGRVEALTPLSLRIKEVAVLAETMLSRKESTPTLTYDDGLAAGQAAAQHALREMPPKPTPLPPPPAPKEAAAKKSPEPDNFGEASQDDIDRLLEELG